MVVTRLTSEGSATASKTMRPVSNLANWQSGAGFSSRTLAGLGDAGGDIATAASRATSRGL